MMAARNARETSAATRSALPLTPPLTCDLCQWPMSLPEHLHGQPTIFGLLVCEQCIEDNLYASTDEPRCEVGMVGTGD